MRQRAAGTEAGAEIFTDRAGSRDVTGSVLSIALADGRPEHRWRMLRDYQDVVKIAADGGVGLWLHGHRHNSYYHPPSDFAPFPVVCAGSATQAGCWSYTEYTLSGRHLRALNRVFADGEGRFRDGTSFELDLWP